LCAGAVSLIEQFSTWVGCVPADFADTLPASFVEEYCRSGDDF
jgi:hypothetical protein